MPIISRGQHTYGDVVITFDGPDVMVSIGAFCSIARGVKILGAAHHVMHRVSTFPFFEKWGLGPPTAFCKGSTVIGDDVWLGEDAVIISGVNIGTGAVVATRAVVTRDVPPYAVVAGMPARVVRYRFPEDTQKALLASRWWELSREQLEAMASDLVSDDPAAVLSFAHKAAEQHTF